MIQKKSLLFKGVKYSIGSFPLMFLGPIIIFSSFKNQENPFFIPVLSVGILIAFLAGYLLFKGVKTITDSLFNNEN